MRQETASSPAQVQRRRLRPDAADAGHRQRVAKKIGLRDFTGACQRHRDQRAARHQLHAPGHGKPRQPPGAASAAYNAGPGREKWRADRPLEGAIYAETIPFSETRDYVKKVMSNGLLFDPVQRQTGLAESPPRHHRRTYRRCTEGCGPSLITMAIHSDAFGHPARLPRPVHQAPRRALLQDSQLVSSHAMAAIQKGRGVFRRNRPSTSGAGQRRRRPDRLASPCSPRMITNWASAR